MPASGSACAEKPAAQQQRKAFWLWSARPLRGDKASAPDGRNLHVAASRTEEVAADVRSGTDAPEAFAESATPSELARLRDVVHAVALSEAVYRLADLGSEAAVDHANSILAEVPQAITTAIKLQCSVESVPHRYIIAETDDTIYVSFVGTKRLQDLLTDINYWQVPLAPAHELRSQSGRKRKAPAGADNNGVDLGLLVHQGFAARSEGVPIQQLYELSRRRNKNLRFCGHSLGGAVAALCALRLLSTHAEAAAHVSCITFACVALGNQDVSRAVQSNGWSHLFHNFILPEDDVVRLALLVQLKGLGTITRELASHALSGVDASPSPRPAGGSPSPDAGGAAASDRRRLLQTSLDFLNKLTADELFGAVPALRDTLAAPPPASPQPSAAQPAPSASADDGGGGKRARGLTVQLPGSPPATPHLRASRPLRRRGLFRRSAHGSPRAHRGRGGAAWPQPELAPPAPQPEAPADSGELAEQESKSIAAARDALERAFTDEAAPLRPFEEAPLPTQQAFSKASAPPDDAPPPPRTWLQGGASAFGSLWRGVATGASALGGGVGQRLVPSYHPFGFQLYLTQEGISVGLHPEARGAPSPELPGKSADLLGATPPNAAAGSTELPAELGADVPHEVAEIMDRGATSLAEGAAAAVAPQPQNRRAQVFHMHRMFNYRMRLLALLDTMGLYSGHGAPPHDGDEARLRPPPPPPLYGDAPPPPPPSSIAESVCSERPPVAQLRTDVVPPLILSSAEVHVQPRLLPGLAPSAGPFRGGLGWVRGAALRRPGGSGAAGPTADPLQAVPPPPPPPRQRGAAPRFEACVRVSGMHLPFVSGGALTVDGDAVPAVAEVPPPQDGATLRLHAEVTTGSVRRLAAHPGAAVPLELSTDFGAASVDARVVVPQCVVVGSTAAAPAELMRALHVAAQPKQPPKPPPPPPAATDGADSPRRTAWPSALRPLQFIQRSFRRGHSEDGGGGGAATESSTDADVPPASPAATATPRGRWARRRGASAPPEASVGACTADTAPPVVLCGGVRYLDVAWDNMTGRALDTHAVSSMWELATLLGPVDAGGVPKALHAWGALIAAIRGGFAALPALLAAHAASAQAAAASTWQRVAEATAVPRHLLGAGNARHLRAVAALRSRPVLSLPRSSHSEGTPSPPPPPPPPQGALKAADGGTAANTAAQQAVAANATKPPSTNAAPDMDAPTAAPAPPPRWRRWATPRRRRRRLSSGVVVSEHSPAEFLYHTPCGVATGAQLPRPQVDALVVAEDVCAWRGAPPQPPLPPQLQSVEARRRSGVAELAAKARAAQAAVVLVVTVPSKAAGQHSAWEWLEEVAQMKAAYGLSAAAPVTVVPIATDGQPSGDQDGHAAAVELHNAVARACLARRGATSEDGGFLSSKL